MTATYQDGIGTLACEECGATFTDGKPDTVGSSIRMRAEGWRIYRPNPYMGKDVCPECWPVVSRR